MNTKRNKIVKVVTAIFLVVTLFVFIKFFTSDTNFETEEVYVQIPTGSTYQDVDKIVAPFLKNKNNFEIMATLRSYPDRVKPGRFLLKQGMNAFQLVGAMRRNVPVKLAFNNQERLENLCERISSQIEPDTTKLLATFRDSIFLQKNGLIYLIFNFIFIFLN